MQFRKYQHIERIDSAETEGLLDGVCLVTPKLDGANGSFYLNDLGELETSSRNRVCTIDADNQGFSAYVNSQPKFRELLAEHPDWRVYCEWLVRHSLSTYRDDAWNKAYVFDIAVDDDNVYFPFCQDHIFEK